MFRLRRKQASDGDSATAVAAPPRAYGDFEGSTDELRRRDRAARRREPRAPGPRFAAPPAAAATRRGHPPSRRGRRHGRLPRTRPRRLPAGDGLPEIARDDVTPGLLRAGILARRLPARARPRRPRRRARVRGPDRPRCSPTATPTPAAGDGYYEQFEPDAALRGRRGAAVDPRRRRRAGRRLADARVRDARAVPLRAALAPLSTATSASRRHLGAQDHAPQGGALRAGRLAPGRLVHGRRALAEPVALAVALR